MTSIARCPVHGLWRRSSTLLLMAPDSQNRPAVLTVKRSAQAKFMPNMVVYPGGLSEPCDFSIEWLNICDKFKEYTVHKGAKFPDIIINDSSNPLKELSPHIGFRIGAIRELFEETGVMLDAISGKPCKVSRKWRDRVNNNPEEFINMSRELGVVPDISKLYSWSTWLTPTHLKKSSRRYDTQFFVSFINTSEDVEASSDDKEVHDVKFWSVEELIEAGLSGYAPVAPPQMYELMRLSQYRNIDQLKEYAQRKNDIGTVRMFPVAILCTDGLLSLLPGDSLYPSDPDLDGSKERLKLDMTLEESLTEYPKHHRIFIRPGKAPQVFCNIDPDQL